jgi:hypothetical protein
MTIPSIVRIDSLTTSPFTREWTVIDIGGLLYLLIALLILAALYPYFGQAVPSFNVQYHPYVTPSLWTIILFLVVARAFHII